MTSGMNNIERKQRRGSTLILVLALLSILILIAATLSYTARLEEITSRNFADGIQARMAAQTGVGFFFASVDGRTSPVSTVQLAGLRNGGELRPQEPAASWMASRGPSSPLPPTGSAGTTSPAMSRTAMTVLTTPGGQSRPARFSNMSAVATDLAQISIIDEASKININQMGSWAELRRADAGLNTPQANAADTSASGVRPIALADALYAVLSSPEVRYRGASPDMARSLARAILAYRYGPDGQPGTAGFDDDGDAAVLAGDGLDNDSDGQVDESGEGTDEADEFVADPRLPARGDDQPFRQVEDLLRVSGVTPALFNALRPYVTVFSVSERRVGNERGAPAQLDLNVATAEEIRDRLRAAFPYMPVETLAQFAANVVDYRDADSSPTLLYVESSLDPIFGTEVTPVISEVYPDSVTDDVFGDDGEYIEIYNPYDTPLSLSGWTLRINSAQRVMLRGTLVPGGFLIVTDDYNGRVDEQTEPRQPGAGSFYDVFGVVPNASNHLMIENPNLDIPNQSGVVELFDKSGNLVDRFRYGGDAAGGLRRSYQRKDPRIRVEQVARCTPYTVPGWSDIQRGRVIAWNLISASSIKNAPFQSALELFNISAVVAGGGSADNLEWRTPQVGRTDGLAFTEAIVDLFTVWTDGRARQIQAAAVMSNASPTTLAQTLSARTPAGGGVSIGECGRINLNTAPAPVLRALPGITYAQIETLLTRRANAARTDAAGLPAPYERLSELIADEEFWGGAPLSTRLNRLSRWIGTIHFSSNAYTLISENRAEPPSGPRLASRSKVETLISTDHDQNQVVVWRYVE
ncbi:MAG: type II secretion system protein GspK [Candidatus Sumerlaeia bacterium]|nr:type II secretion system protein GspK [Candidatus Sumerlaeia bacterium]